MPRSTRSPFAAGGGLGDDLEADGHHAGRAPAASRGAAGGPRGPGPAAAGIEESLRWMPTDPMFSRWVTEDIELFGVHLPEGPCCTSASAPPTAIRQRWERPDEFDISRAPQALVRRSATARTSASGMHVARAEMPDRHRRLARPAAQSAARPRCRATQVQWASTNGGPPRSPSSSVMHERWRLMSESGYSQPDFMLLGAEHVRRYQETDGAVGYLWNGVPTLLLTTTGRRTGQPRERPRSSSLATARTTSSWLRWVAGPEHPPWYLNLLGRPSSPRYRSWPSHSRHGAHRLGRRRSRDCGRSGHRALAELSHLSDPHRPRYSGRRPEPVGLRGKEGRTDCRG